MPTLDIAATTVSYVTASDGDPVVFLHSGPGGAADWRAVFDRFGPGFRLVAVNGFGKGQTSPWPRGQIHIGDVVELVAGLATSLGGPAHIVGPNRACSLKPRRSPLRSAPRSQTAGWTRHGAGSSTITRHPAAGTRCPSTPDERCLRSARPRCVRGQRCSPTRCG